MKTEIETETESSDVLLCPNNNNNIASIKKNIIVNNNNNSISSGHSDQSNDGMEMDCGGCGESIRERTVLCVGGRSWHSGCLKCCACSRPLHDQHSCFLRGMRLYCRHDYALTFGAKCAKCGRSVGAGDWVRRARERVYHLACFACDACSRQLSTGEQFALLDARLLCKAHYLDVVEGNNTSSSEDCDSEHGGKGSKTKRVRTTFTEEQLSVLQANFQLDSNPDGQDLERIAHVTGLSKRVTQVWFQNSRARQKKHSGKIKTQMHHSPPLQHHPGEQLYPGGVSMVGSYLGGYQGAGSAGSESPGSPMTPLTPLTPMTPTTPTHHLQAQFCHQGT
ncbi:LIM/homeobox protein Awh-like isoform X2 [Venturia canescens]|uniref:LIM/homeobox protein Awh-like isoform X2 n=1 Tax=Venturia canescens TaxID=32260 RepID=UPI001C9BFED6|nr:LIM/homeobox protein Awh-like isoform X2 [Venturia canescens]